MSSLQLTYKEKVQQSFSKKASSYDAVAKVQKQAAQDLAQFILSRRNLLIDGPVLEVGAGTGFLTSDLVSTFSDRELTVSDISSSMLETCKQRIQHHACKPAKLQFETIDAEKIIAQDQYAIIASSFALQWLSDLRVGTANLCRAIKPGGSLFFSIPGESSFAQWRELCSKLNIPFTGNPLPSKKLLEEIAQKENMELELRETIFLEHFSNRLTMLKTLQELGAGTQRNGLVLSTTELRNFMRAADSTNHNGINLNYQILYGRMTKLDKRSSSVLSVS